MLEPPSGVWIPETCSEFNLIVSSWWWWCWRNEQLPKHTTRARSSWSISTRPHLYKSNMSASSATVSLASCFLPHKMEFQAFTLLYVSCWAEWVIYFCSFIWLWKNLCPDWTNSGRKERDRRASTRTPALLRQKIRKIKTAFRSREARSTAELSLNGCANMREYIFVLVLNKEKLHRKLET